MAVLVAGVGYIGARLVELLLQRGEEVVAIDNFFSTSAQAIATLRKQDRFLFFRGSITNPAALRRAFSVKQISTVFCLAAQASAHPDAAPVKYTEITNLIGPRMILDCAREFGIAKIVFASSFKVYGHSLPPVVDEDTPYGRFSDLSHLSKYYVEKLLEMYAAEYGLTCLPLRMGIAYGISPVMKTDYRFMTVPNKFCLQAARGQEIELHVGCDSPAGFIHVADAAEALFQASAGDFTGYKPINVVTEVCSVAQVAACVREAAEQRGLQVSIRRLDGRSDLTHDRPVIVRSSLDYSLCRSQRNLGNTLGELIDCFRG